MPEFTRRHYGTVAALNLSAALYDLDGLMSLPNLLSMVFMVWLALGEED